MIDPATGLIVGAGVGATGSLLSGLVGSSAAKKGAAQMAEAIRQSTALQREMFERGWGALTPYREAGAGIMPYLSSAATMESPLYRMRMEDTMRELNRQLGARGQFFSGRAMQDILGDAMRRITAEEAEARWRRGFSLADLGRLSAAMSAQAASQYGGQAGETLMGGARSLADIYGQGASAWQDAFGGLNQAIQGSLKNYYTNWGVNK